MVSVNIVGLKIIKNNGFLAKKFGTKKELEQISTAYQEKGLVRYPSLGIRNNG